jgi:hypothetical protein
MIVEVAVLLAIAALAASVGLAIGRIVAPAVGRLAATGDDDDDDDDAGEAAGHDEGTGGAVVPEVGRMERMTAEEDADGR